MLGIMIPGAGTLRAEADIQERSQVVKEFEIDAALVALCSIWMGSAFFSLYRAFGAYPCSL
jgi:hypothetical protein